MLIINGIIVIPFFICLQRYTINTIKQIFLLIIGNMIYTAECEIQPTMCQDRIYNNYRIYTLYRISNK